MIWIIAKREIQDHLLSLAFVITLALCLALVTLGTYVSIKDYERRLGEYSAGIQRQAGASSYGIKVYRKPEVLGIFSQGIEKDIGNFADYGMYRGVGYIKFQSEMLMSRSIYLESLAPINFSFVIRVVMSLLAIFLAHGAISGERQAGVLRLSMANSVKRSDIIIGKFVGGFFCLLIALTISTVASMLMVQLSSVVQLTREEWLRLSLIFLSAILYLSSFYALGLLVSCFSKTPAMSLIVSVLLWGLFVIIIPNAAPAMVHQFWHRTSPNDMQRELDELRRDYHRMENERFGSPRTRDNSEETANRLQELRDSKNREIRKLVQRHVRELEQQTKAGRWAARFSLCGSFHFSVSTLARTDVGAYKKLMRGMYQRFIEMDRARRLGNRDAQDYSHSIGSMETISDSLHDIRPDIISLFLFPFVFLMGAYAVFVRNDIR